MFWTVVVVVSAVQRQFFFSARGAVETCTAVCDDCSTYLYGRLVGLVEQSSVFVREAVVVDPGWLCSVEEVIETCTACTYEGC